MSALFLLAMSGKQLQIGDIAPLLNVQPLTGKSVQIEKGKVYAIDFWATWCAACLEDLPRVSAVADQLKDKVEFLGINILDDKDVTQSKPDTREQQLKRIGTFVKNAAPILRFPIAIDDETNSTAYKWLTASGQTGLPVSFVINRNQQVVWFGSSRDLNDVLQQVLADTWDTEKFRLSIEKQRQLNSKFDQDRARVRAAVESKDIEKVFTAIRGRGLGSNEKPNGILAVYASDQAIQISPRFAIQLVEKFVEMNLEIPRFQWVQLLAKTLTKTKDEAIRATCVFQAQAITEQAPSPEKAVTNAYLAKVLINAKRWNDARKTLQIATQSLNQAPEAERESLVKLIESLYRELP